MPRFVVQSTFAMLSATCLIAQSGAVREQTMRERMTADEAAMLGMRDLRVAADLNLTADQQTKIRAAFDEAAEFRRGSAELSLDLRKQLAAAVTSGDQAMIGQISEALGKILQEQIACQARTVAKVYAVLTPEQKTKLDQEVKASLGALEQRWERRRGL